jgi:hypothetical protein
MGADRSRPGRPRPERAPPQAIPQGANPMHRFVKRLAAALVQEIAAAGGIKQSD